MSQFWEGFKTIIDFHKFFSKFGKALKSCCDFLKSLEHKKSGIIELILSSLFIIHTTVLPPTPPPHNLAGLSAVWWENTILTISSPDLFEFLFQNSLFYPQCVQLGRSQEHGGLDDDLLILKKENLKHEFVLFKVCTCVALMLKKRCKFCGLVLLLSIVVCSSIVQLGVNLWTSTEIKKGVNSVVQFFC